jgi:hypothetical protein
MVMPVTGATGKAGRSLIAKALSGACRPDRHLPVSLNNRHPATSDRLETVHGSIASPDLATRRGLTKDKCRIDNAEAR